MSMVQPMLATTEVDAPLAVPISVQSIETSELARKYDAKATSLRRACTALLFFSVLCSRPWPSAGWLGYIGAFSVLCASSHKLLCRARVARFFSAIVAIVAGITLVHLVASIHADKPQQIGNEIQTQCVKMPAATFEWAHSIVSQHKCMKKAVAFLARHVDTPSSAITAGGPMVLDKLEVAASANDTSLPATLVVSESAWSQEAACGTAAHVATRVAKMMMLGSALAHLLLIVTALAVVKRVCCLRCVAYKCGLLTWKRCGACKRQPAAAAATTEAVTGKELA